MAKAPKEDETKLDLDEAQLASVVKRMLNTPPTPHKPKKTRKADNNQDKVPPARGR